MKTVLVVSLLFLGACSSPDRKNQEDLISVPAALLMAKSSYILGCTEAYNSLKKKGHHETCKKKAQDHVENDLEYILKQDGKPKTSD